MIAINAAGLILLVVSQFFLVLAVQSNENGYYAAYTFFLTIGMIWMMRRSND